MARRRQRGEVTPEMKAAILYSMARKAAAGSTQAAKVLLDEYAAQHGAGAAEAEFSLLEEAFSKMKERIKDDGGQV